MSAGIELASGEIAEDIIEYLWQERADPRRMLAWRNARQDCSVAAAGGYILSLLPGAGMTLHQGLRPISPAWPVPAMLAGGMQLEDIAAEILKPAALT